MKLLIIALFLRIFSNPLANVFQKRLTTNFSSFVISSITYFGLIILALPIIMSVDYNFLQSSVWFYGIFGGLLGAFGNACLIKALSLGDLSVLGPINSYKSIVSMIFGIFLLKEIPSFVGVFSIFLIIAGSYFLFDFMDEKFSIMLFRRKDIIYRILALIFTAIEAIFIKKVIVLSSIEIAFIFWCIFGGVFSFLFAVLKKEKFLKFDKTNIKDLVFLIILFGIMQYSTNYVFERMNTAYALALFQLSSLISVIFGCKIFNEKNIARKFFGSLIMTIGAVIIILG